MKKFLESQEFYDMMQQYRHLPMNNQKIVKQAFDDIKQAISSRLDAPVILQNAAPCNDHGLVFKGIRKGGKFYTLDGQREIFDPYYKKYSPIALLTEEEQRFLLTDYLKMRTIINECASILSK